MFLWQENAALCDIYPIKRHNCDEMDSVRRQLERIRELENYVDAQYGGPGEGFLRIVTDPFEAREVINAGKLAVVLGIEVSSLFGCKLLHGIPQCDEASIDAQVEEFWDAGVRQLELSNKFDNALGGVAGDAGSTGILVNTGQFQQTGRWWDMRTCEIPEGVAPEDFHDHDRPQEHPPAQLPEQDAIFGAINDLYGPGAVAPVYGATPHCNDLGLTDLGRHVLDRLVERGALIDPDHMGVKARTEALDHLDAVGYGGVLSSHSWSTPAAYEKIAEMGGFLAAIPGRSLASWVEDWREYRSYADDRHVFGMGYGADNNGFANQPGPFADEGLPQPLAYPFEGFGGVTVHQQVSGERVYDANVDGVAHYGLYPDFWEAAQLLGGPELQADMERAPEAYLQTWERAWGVAGDACRPDVPDLDPAAVAALAPRTPWKDVLLALGQPTARDADSLTYCVEGGTVELALDASGRLVGGAPPVVPSPSPLPATGGGPATAGLLALGAAAVALVGRRRAGAGTH